MKRLSIRLLTTALVTSICLLAIGVGALAATVRIRGGEWRMPERKDVEALVYIIEKPKPARTIFIERGALEVRHGRDDGASGVSSLVAEGKTHTIPKYRASNANWKRLMTCVESKFAGLDVNITDVRPSTGDYVTVKVGGKQRHIGKEGGAIGGLAPFNGQPLNNVIVYAFDQGGKYRTKINCETIAHEIGHIYGLDHTYDCRDIMSYQQGCGPKKFTQKLTPCGEHSIRDCHDGAPVQSSWEMLHNALGPSREP